MAEPAGGSRDQHPVRGSDRQDAGDALVGCEGVDRHRRRVSDAQPGRNRSQPFHVARHVLCVAAARPRPAVDWRAVLESRVGTSLADDKAGELCAGT
jgi:hypothetical protein